jgi:Fur family peroxide stress response transcriptional regulator
MTLNRGYKVKRDASDIDRQCEGFEQACRERGLRVTPQRLAVYRALASDLSHPTAESVYTKLAPKMSGLSQATVYRILELLEAEDLIRRVSGPQAIGRFDANLEPHQHILCRVCGSLSDVSLPEFNTPDLPEVPDFAVEELDIRLVGRCHKCAGREDMRLSPSGRRHRNT